MAVAPNGVLRVHENESAVIAETSVPDNPMDYRAVWERKPALREVYRDIYQRIVDALVTGRILEIGGGSGNFKAFAPSAVSSDILYTPWLDLVCDAQRLPFADGAFANIVMVDVLHHVENPILFFLEARRILRPGGRVICCEPAITPLSGVFYRLFHQEPVDMSVDPLATRAISAKDPYDSNQAIPTLLAGKYREALHHRIPEIELARVDWFSFVAYPLSGGFKAWSALPEKAARPLLSLEWNLRRLLGRIAAFRLLAVYEKTR
jgi:SAM-dependent methyltransferase